MNREITSFLHETLMCSVFANPLDPGLTYDEVIAAGRQAGYLDGEIGDAARNVLDNYIARDRYIPQPHAFTLLLSGFGEDPELLDYDAIDFVYAELNQQVRAVGTANARVDRNVMVEKAVSAGLDRNAIEAAITSYILGGSLKDNKGSISFAYTSGQMALPGEQSRQSRRNHVTKRPFRAKALQIVRDIIARRSDGRSLQAEPLDAFAEALERIGFKPFRMWWTQTVSELRSSDPNSAPVSCVVLSAALVEGALTFAAKHSRDRQLGAFQSSNFDGEPRNWKAEKLIESASAGGASALLTPPLRARAEHLNKTRQRVHAGRMLGDYPAGPPDLRPEEGRDAKATAEQVVRAVLDWLERSQSA